MVHSIAAEKTEIFFSSNEDMRYRCSSPTAEDGPLLIGDTGKRQHKERYLAKFCPSMNLVGAFLTAVLILLSVALTLAHDRGHSNAPMYRPQYSPFYDHFNTPIITKYLDPYISVTPDHPENIYTQTPSPEVDAAWEKITHSKIFFSLSAKQMTRMGKDPSVAVQIPQGLDGAGGFVATEDNIHQLHCLNVLRKALIHNYHYYWGNEWGFMTPLALQYHIGHCLDILRQHIMCTPESDLYTYEWREDEDRKWPDFAIKRTCKDFDALRETLREKQRADIVEWWHNITMPADAKKLPPHPMRLELLIDNDTWMNPAGRPLGPLPGLKGKDYCLG